MKKTHLAAALTVGLLGLSLAIPAARQSEPQPVELVELNAENWDQFVPTGKEVDAIYGDIVLRNGHLTAVIAKPVEGRNANMTVRDVSGGLIDLTTREHPSDQLSAFYPGKRVFKYDRAVVKSGDKAPSSKGQQQTIELIAPASDGKPQATTSYHLSADQPYLEIATRFTNPHAAAVTFELEDDLRLDGVKEDMVRSPNGEADSFWAYDRYWNQAYGISVLAEGAVSGKLQMNSDTKLSTLKYLTADGKTAVTIPPGKTLTLTRRIYPAQDLLELRAVMTQSPVHAARFTITDRAGQPISRALIELLQVDGTPYGSARATSAGTLDTSLPAGKYAVRVSAFGNRLDHDDLRIAVESSTNSFPLKFSDFQLGKVDVRVTDDAGRPIPCKVAFRRQQDQPVVDFGPETADFAVKNLRYTPNGKFTQELPAGNYELDISHGPEYELGHARVVVTPGQTKSVTAQLARTVDTTGWVSGDFHSHSTTSGDNTSSQLGRVLNLVCEQIEFAPCTEHNRVDTYDAHIKQLGIEPYLATVSGIEMTGTPLPLNHQNAFPMKMTPHIQDNGAPKSKESMDDQIEQLALWDDHSEKLVQVNHPDIGWMFYDRNGDGQPDGGFERAFPYMDVVEVHPIQYALHLAPTYMHANGKESHNSVFNWLQLLNEGFRIYGVVNTDAHYNFHGSGSLRNWIQSSTDDPAKIDPKEMMHAAEQGRLVMSNGPFLEVRAAETGKADWVTAGQDLAAPSKNVTLKVRVQCPGWLDIDRLFVLVNGRISPQHDFSREKTPEVFRSGVVKFDQTLEIPLTGDAHLVVVAGDVGGDLVSVMGPEMGKSEPTALSNPIFVDVQGDGFQPNKDTMDAPLPVKFGAGK